MRRAAVLVLLFLLAGCGGTSATRERPPTADPTAKESFSRVVDNTWLPLRPGSRWVYRSHGEQETRIVTTVMDQPRVVDGVTCVVVHDVERTLDGKVLEDTFDWYAQDGDGNVWYFGEDTTSFEDGKKSKEGSWEAGVDGAKAGIVMLAAPKVGDAYQQEDRKGVAEDRASVLSLTAHQGRVPEKYGSLLVISETTPLEPKLEERKYYARGVGSVYEETVKGGKEKVLLVSYEPGS